MNELSTLAPPAGAQKTGKRVGRGHGSGNGTTAGKGTKGQKSRSGHGIKAGFEGGQMPLQRRVPKRGFTNIFRKAFDTVNVGDLNRFDDGQTVTIPMLIGAGLVKKTSYGVKLLGDGTLEKKLTVTVNGFSKSAKEKVESKGGTIEVI